MTPGELFARTGVNRVVAEIARQGGTGSWYACSEHQWRPAVDDGRLDLLAIVNGEPTLRLTPKGQAFLRLELAPEAWV